MLQELTTKAEKQAERAESLGAFRKIKLLHIKDEVTKILSLIGRDGIFDESENVQVVLIVWVRTILRWGKEYEKTKSIGRDVRDDVGCRSAGTDSLGGNCGGNECGYG